MSNGPKSLEGLKRVVPVKINSVQGRSWGGARGTLEKDTLDNDALYIVHHGDMSSDYFPAWECEWEFDYTPTYVERFFPAPPMEDYKLPTYAGQPLYNSPDEILRVNGEQVYRVLVYVTGPVEK